MTPATSLPQPRKRTRTLRMVYRLPATRRQPGASPQTPRAVAAHFVPATTSALAIRTRAAVADLESRGLSHVHAVAVVREVCACQSYGEQWATVAARLQGAAHAYLGEHRLALGVLS